MRKQTQRFICIVLVFALCLLASDWIHAWLVNSAIEAHGATSDEHMSALALGRVVTSLGSIAVVVLILTVTGLLSQD